MLSVSRSRILCQGRKTVPVPGEPRVPVFSGPGSGKPIHEPSMQAQTQGRPANDGKRNIVTRQIDARESIALLEVTQAAALFLPVSEIGIHEVRNSTVGAGLDRLCNQCVCGRLIPVSNQGNNVHDSCLHSLPVGCELNEPDQFLFKISANEDTCIGEGRTHAADLFQVFTEMRKAPSLADWTFVVDLPNTGCKGI